MKRKTLTAAGVARVRPPDDPQRRRMDWDAVVPGLALRTTAFGSKSWVLVTRFNGHVVFATLGKPPGIGLPKARDLAREGLARVARGEDPRQRAAAIRPQVDDFEIVATDFVEKWSKVRNRTWQETARQLTKYVRPEWKSRRLTQITRADVVALVETIATKNGPIMANRVLATVKKLFSWALDRGLVDVHPVARLMPPGKETARDRVLTDAELRKLWKAWDSMAYPWGHALQLVALTAARRGEVEAMAWGELDLDAGVWAVPAERVKTKVPHLVPLSDSAAEVLARIPRLDGCGYVFTTRGHKAIRDWSGAVATATEESGVTGWSAHDLRRTVRTNLSRLDVAADIAERVLGHTMPGVRGVYDRHDYLAQKRDALERWAAHLTALVARDG